MSGDADGLPVTVTMTQDVLRGYARMADTEGLTGPDGDPQTGIAAFGVIVGRLHRLSPEIADEAARGRFLAFVDGSLAGTPGVRFVEGVGSWVRKTDDCG